jgi:PDZ domain-containing secreted protein
LVLEVAAGSKAFKFLQANDVILSFNSSKINTLNDLLQADSAAKEANTEMLVFRNKNEVKVFVGQVGEK